MHQNWSLLVILGIVELLFAVELLIQFQIFGAVIHNLCACE